MTKPSLRLKYCPVEVNSKLIRSGLDEKKSNRVRLTESEGPPDPPHEHGEECGGKGGVPYLSIPQAPVRITKVTVWHHDYVDGIQLETEIGVLPRIGGTGKHRDVRKDTFELDREEYVTGITVEFWQYVDRIIFHTNKRNYGPFGGDGGRLKKTLMGPPHKKVVGFKGRHWEFVDSVQLMVS